MEDLTEIPAAGHLAAKDLRLIDSKQNTGIKTRFKQQ